MSDVWAPLPATNKDQQAWLDSAEGGQKLADTIYAIKSRLDKPSNINTMIDVYNGAIKNAGASGMDVPHGVDSKFSMSGQNNATEAVFTENTELLDRLVAIDTQFDPIDGVPYGNLSNDPAVQGEINTAAKAVIDEVAELLKLAEEVFDLQAEFVRVGEDAIKEAELAEARALAADALSGDKGGGWSSLGKKGAEEATKAREQIEQEVQNASSAAAQIQNENYLKKPFQEQCFIQANLFKFIRLQNSSAELSSHQKLPYSAPGEPNASITCDLHPFGFINTLTQSPSMATLFDIEPHVLSQLQPEVRLYKVFNNGGKDFITDEVEIYFPASTVAGDVKAAFTNKRRRGYGVGLKSFDWANEAGDAFAVKRSIRATLKIHASNMAELLRDRGGFRYADLALKTGKSIADLHPHCAAFGSDSIAGTPSTLDFRLKAVVGYAIPPNLSISGRDKEQLMAAIHDAYTTLELTPTIHTFDFDEAGRVTFSVDYLAYVEDFFDDYYYDIFPNSADYIARIEEKAAITTKDESAEVALQSSTPNRLRESQVQSLSSLTRGLFDDNKMWFIRIPYGQLSTAVLSPGEAFPVYNAEGALSNSQEVDTSITNMQQSIATATSENKATDKAAEERLKALTAAAAGRYPSDAYEQVSFFYLADLVDLILKNIGNALGSETRDALSSIVKKADEDGGFDTTVLSNEGKILKAMSEHFKRLRVVLGPIEIRENARLKKDMNSPTQFSHVSIGSIPISTKYFIEWMTEKMLSKNRSGYTLSSFLTDFMKSYVRNFLNSNTCSGESAAQKISMFTSAVTSYSPHKDGRDELSAIIAINGFKKSPANLNLNEAKYVKAMQYAGMTHPILNTMGSRISVGSPNPGQQNQKNYLIFYGSRVSPKEEMNGNRAQDASRGIHHYMLGASRGIVKNITLEKTQVKGHKEMRFEQEGYDGLLQLREVYNVIADSFLLPNAYPGTYMFVDPRGFAPDTQGFEYARGKSKVPIDQFELSRYGIGGYYVITKTEHRIAEGEASSRVHAAWTAQIIKAGSSPPSSSDPKDLEKDPDTSTIRKCGDNKSYEKLITDNPAPAADDSDDIAVNPDENSSDDNYWPTEGMEGVDPDLISPDELLGG